MVGGMQGRFKIVSSRHMVSALSISRFLMRFTMLSLNMNNFPTTLWISNLKSQLCLSVPFNFDLPTGKLKSNIVSSTHKISIGSLDKVSFKCLIFFLKEFMLRLAISGLLEMNIWISKAFNIRFKLICLRSGV